MLHVDAVCDLPRRLWRPPPQIFNPLSCWFRLAWLRGWERRSIVHSTYGAHVPLLIAAIVSRFILGRKPKIRLVRTWKFARTVLRISWTLWWMFIFPVVLSDCPPRIPLGAGAIWIIQASSLRKRVAEEHRPHASAGVSSGYGAPPGNEPALSKSLSDLSEICQPVSCGPFFAGLSFL